MKKVGIYVKEDPRALEKAEELGSWLVGRNFEPIVKKSQIPVYGLPLAEAVHAPPDLECVLVLGGDGTFLSAVRWIGDQDIPVMGIKFGGVGFLAEAAEEMLFEIARQVLDRHYQSEFRMRLTATVLSGRNSRMEETVLNDVVINRGALARLASIKTYVNGAYLTTFRADGLIVATPTGSTAYSLAAGGPIVHPDVQSIIITPICPFTLTNRPLIVPDTAEISIQLEETLSDVVLTFDGQAGFPIDEKQVISIRKSKNPVRVITIPGQSYFNLLKTKLRWSGGQQ